MEYIIIIPIAIAVSWITTKIVTIKYFDVIDGYVKGLMDDTAQAVKETVGAKSSEKRRCVKSNFCEDDDAVEIRYSK